MCNASFRGNMTGKYIYGIILVIDGHLQSQKAKIMTVSFVNKYK